MSPDLVRAAGGVVWRPGASGTEVLLVHRPRYDDWTLPKGKCDKDEADEAAAVREVFEETGLRCRMGAELAESHYTDARGRPKVVRYWEMTPIDGAFEVNGEVDEVRWMLVDEARRRLSYARDLPVLDSFERARRGGGD
ncbi:MAG TPA: NUDIX hydrolase [Acidimicrobiales bacterium]|nr:NUDIX hydrolase [Acidimicrobiales bacterium]